MRLCRKGKLSMFKKGRSPYSSADDTSPTDGKRGDLAAVMGKGVLPGTLTSVGAVELNYCRNRDCCSSVCEMLVWCCSCRRDSWHLAQPQGLQQDLTLSLAAGGHRRDLSKHMAAQLAMFEQGMYNLEGNLEVQLGAATALLLEVIAVGLCSHSMLLICSHPPAAGGPFSMKLLCPSWLHSAMCHCRQLCWPCSNHLHPAGPDREGD